MEVVRDRLSARTARHGSVGRRHPQSGRGEHTTFTRTKRLKVRLNRGRWQGVTLMGCCLVVGLIGGYSIVRNVGLGVVCDLNDVLCRCLRVDKKVFVIREGKK